MVDRTPYAERTLAASAVVLALPGSCPTPEHWRAALRRAGEAIDALQEAWVAARGSKPEPTIFALAVAVERLRRLAADGGRNRAAEAEVQFAVAAFFAARAEASHSALQGAG